MEALDGKFWSKIRFLPHTCCWIWTASKSKGYGRFGSDPRSRYAHRLSLIVHSGENHPELDALHSCDNPSCVNPAHLRWGTHDENMKEMKAKKRGVSKKGAANHNSKLTESEVRQIRFLYSLGGITQKQIAEIFGVHHTSISLIVRRKHWGWLK